MDREQGRAERGAAELFARRQKHVEQRCAPLVHRTARADLARQGVAVRVQAGRGNANKRVTLAHPLRSEDLLAIDGPDEKAREVIRIGGVMPGNLRGLAAEERRAEARACVGHRTDHSGRRLRVDLRGRELIEEEERLGAIAARVHAVMDEVSADDLVAVEERASSSLVPTHRCRDGDLVGAGRRREPAELPDSPRTSGRACARSVLHPGERVLGARDVHAGVGYVRLMLSPARLERILRELQLHRHEIVAGEARRTELAGSCAVRGHHSSSER